jgi:hypothetical protein
MGGAGDPTEPDLSCVLVARSEGRHLTGTLRTLAGSSNPTWATLAQL